MNIQTLRFCYEISAEAKIARDTRTDEPIKTYAEIRFENAALKEHFDYNKAHTSLVKVLAKDTGLNVEWIKPISVEEYDALEEVEEIAQIPPDEEMV